MEDEFSHLLGADAVLMETEGSLDGRLGIDLCRIELDHVSRHAPTLTEVFNWRWIELSARLRTQTRQNCFQSIFRGSHAQFGQLSCLQHALQNQTDRNAFDRRNGVRRSDPCI